MKSTAAATVRAPKTSLHVADAEAAVDAYVTRALNGGPFDFATLEFLLAYACAEQRRSDARLAAEVLQ